MYKIYILFAVFSGGITNLAADEFLFPVSFRSLITEHSYRAVWWTVAVLMTIVPALFLYVKQRRATQLLWKVPGSNGNQFLVALAIVTSLMRNKAASANVVSFQALCGLVQIFNRERLLRFWFGFRPILIFYKPETVEVILSSNSIIDKTFVYDFLHLWFKDGLITSSGFKWKKRRKLLTPAFHFRILEDFLPVINDESRILVGKLRQEIGDEPFDMVPFITLCSLDILCETAMGKHVGAQVHSDSPYLRALREASEMFASRIIKPWLWPDFIFYMSSGGQRFKQCMQEMGDFTRNVIYERKEEMLQQMKKNENENNERKRRWAFLDLLLHHHIRDNQLSIEDIREEVDTFMFAGHDTTAVGMSWTLYLIGLYPEVQRKLQEEVDEIFGDDKDRLVTMEDLKEMKYMECVMKESQRLYPSLPFIGRQLHEDAKINGHVIPRGTACMLFTFMLHRNEEVFANAEEFDPDRFTPENATGRHPYAYIPFSAGPRNCIGQKFAIMEQKVVLANMIRNFKLKSWDKRDEIHLVAEMVLRSDRGLRMSVELR